MMKSTHIGQMTKADEGLNHQIADTFATVRESDRNWTEKVWGSMAKNDGSLQIVFGLGKYINRNVMDAFGGISRGREQWTVRASRRLDENLEETKVGPLTYEVIEPFKAIRYRLEANETQPIAFDVVMRCELPASFEDRNLVRTGYRISTDVVRYHQGGVISGWVEVEGVREEVKEEEWHGIRDHSWGMRGDIVGEQPVDIQPNTFNPVTKAMLWGTWVLKRPDGSLYEIQHFLWESELWGYVSGWYTYADGTREAIKKMKPTINESKDTKEFVSGTFELTMENGDVRVVEVEASNKDTGFYMRTGLYTGSWNGGAHGSWRGDYHQDGEKIENVTTILDQLGQFRDVPVTVKEGDAIGHGIQEKIFWGDWPQYGVTTQK